MAENRSTRIMVRNQKKWTLFDPGVFNLFISPGEVVEVRIPKVFGKCPAWGNEFSKGTVAGYFDDHALFCKAVKQADKFPHGGIYFTLQVIDPRLIGRAFNRLKPANLTTSDQNVVAYRWLPIDIDPVRPAGISSSDHELVEALKLRDEVVHRVMENLKFPSPIRANSGNGGHALFRLPDMPANDETQTFIKNTLEGIAAHNNTDRIKIDTSIHNPARILRLYGTTARKGDAVPAGTNREARSYRMAFIDDLGEFNNG